MESISRASAAVNAASALMSSVKSWMVMVSSLSHRALCAMDAGHLPCGRVGRARSPLWRRPAGKLHKRSAEAPHLARMPTHGITAIPSSSGAEKRGNVITIRPTCCWCEANVAISAFGPFRPVLGHRTI